MQGSGEDLELALQYINGERAVYTAMEGLARSQGNREESAKYREEVARRATIMEAVGLSGDYTPLKQNFDMSGRILITQGRKTQDIFTEELGMRLRGVGSRLPNRGPRFRLPTS